MKLIYDVSDFRRQYVTLGRDRWFAGVTHTVSGHNPSPNITPRTKVPLFTAGVGRNPPRTQPSSRTKPTLPIVFNSSMLNSVLNNLLLYIKPDFSKLVKRNGLQC